LLLIAFGAEWFALEPFGAGTTLNQVQGWLEYYLKMANVFRSSAMKAHSSVRHAAQCTLRVWAGLFFTPLNLIRSLTAYL
jgi:hypothetical protein